MSKRLLILGIICLVALVTLVGAPRTVLSRSTDTFTLSNGGRDFALPRQQGEPTPTPTTGDSPLPTPTSTPIPAPTNLPPTGADLTQRMASTILTDLEQEAGGPSYLATGSLLYPVRLAASAIDLDTQVKPLGWRQVTEGEQEISIWHMVNKAAGWHLNSVVPGQPGNAVISGHNNIGGSVFRYLHRLEPGDEITVWTNEGTAVAYTVATVDIVPEKYASTAQQAANAQAISPTSDERLTLITCWPLNSNTHRVIVVAHPAE
ncbi:MAG: sortase [Caldilineaceae bacterium]